MLKLIKVEFHKKAPESAGPFRYSVIGAVYNDMWIFIKNRKRNGYEIPAGKIEDGESPYDTAARELAEETGSTDFRLFPVSAYSVTEDQGRGAGMLYFALVARMGDIPDTQEVESVIYGDCLPENLSFPEIQKELFRKLVAFRSNMKSNVSGRPEGFNC